MAQVEFQVPGPGTYIIEAAPSLPPLSQPGTAADVLTGEQFYGEDGNPVTGTMPDNPAEAVIIQGGGSYTIPKGYHTGKGTVTSEGTELPTLANPANAGEIISGKQSIGQNGETLTGTMPNNGAVSKDLTAGEKYIIPAGYHNGQGKVTAPTVASETPGTAEAVDILSEKTAWVNGEQITGSIPTKTAEDVTIQGASVSVPSGYYGPNIAKAIPTVEQTVPTISVSPGGLITAQAQQTEGFVAGGTKSATNQLPVQGAQTITPSTTAQTIQPNVYLTGAQTVQGDANLVPDNIKEAVSIFGVTGTYAGSGGDFAVPLTVTVDSGATVTAMNGDTTLTATSVDGHANFILTSGGTWQVTARLGDLSTGTTVKVPTTLMAELKFPGQLIYYGIVTPLNMVSGSTYKTTVATSNLNYAIFCVTSSRSNVDAYSPELTQVIVENTIPYIPNFSATSVGEYALFGGGGDWSSKSNVVYAYNSDLTQTKPTGLTTAKWSLTGATVGDYALFAGGISGQNSDSRYNTYYSTVDTYDPSLTRGTAQAMKEARGNSAAANVGEYLLIAGGVNKSTSSSVVDVYDKNLTHTVAENMSSGRNGLAATSVGDYVLFAGGVTNIVDAYDTSLTRTTPTPLSESKNSLAATTIGDYGLFGGGLKSSTAFGSVDAYDTSLTRTTPTPLSEDRYNLAATSINNYALFGGGIGRDGSSSIRYATVDVYTIK